MTAESLAAPSAVAPVFTSVAMRGIVKRFPGVLANDRVDLEVASGEIVGLLGENGAGKSTLMKILYGLDRPDEGTIELDGAPVSFHSPLDAIRAGIGMVHQHFMLVPTMTVAENVALGLPSSRGLRTDYPVVAERLADLSRQYGLRIYPSSLVGDLSVGEQQRVEILKTLYRNARLLILDEPTAVLTPQEVDEFFAFLRTMREQGKSIIFISHKLHEVMDITDRVSVLRDGRNAGTVATSETSKSDLARRMVGRVFALTRELPERPLGPVRLALEGVCIDDSRGVQVVRDMDLDVRGGEIVGIAGVSGNGQKHLAEGIAGLCPVTTGSIGIDGRDVTNAVVGEIVDAGLAYVPEERNRDGMIKSFSISENLIMREPGAKRFLRGGLYDFGRIQSHAEELIGQFAVKTPSANTAIGNLSGGNAQKVILARELSREPAVLVVAQPTRGLDIGASEFIRDRLVAQRQRGAAVVLISEDLDEVLSLADRIVVMFEGQSMGSVERAEATPELIGLMMAGMSLEQARAQIADEPA